LDVRKLFPVPPLLPPIGHMLVIDDKPSREPFDAGSYLELVSESLGQDNR